MFESTYRELLDPAVLSRLGNLPLFARKPMLGNVSGRHRSPHRGSSVEFAEYRKYVAGDDPRRLDWRAYARSDRYYIKEFEADTNLRLCVVLDTSGSMRYKWGDGETKLSYGKKMAATLGHLAVKQGDAFGISCAAAKIGTEIPPKRSPAHLRNIYKTLMETEARGETGMVDALHSVAEQVAQRALVVVISDLFVPPEQLSECFQHLRFRKHDIAVFHLLENQELEFDFDRPTRFVDLEGGSPLLVEPIAIRRQYQAALKEYFEGLDAAVRDSAVDYHRIQIDEPYGDVLGRFLIGRKPRRART
ncbi:MAG: DUF58 domain-containing protein [Planctomycetales bacterium]|nr:DUF58 domain-containing protein [Planctomycetales bacterium]